MKTRALFSMYHDHDYLCDNKIIQFVVMQLVNRCMYIRPDQLNKLLHGFARSNFWANRKKKNLIKLGGAYVQ